jgi:hypothetical protein
MRIPTPLLTTLGIAACALQTGCAIITVEPLWELTKAAAVVANSAVALSPPRHPTRSTTCAPAEQRVH